MDRETKGLGKLKQRSVEVDGMWTQTEVIRRHGGNEVETEEKELGIKSNEPKGDEK